MFPIFTICIIVKNDAKNLRKCLECLLPYKYEVVVADTGSSDGTRKTAVELASKVCDFEWCNDFSKARNFVAGQASNDIILMIDSDEFITNIDKKSLEEFIKKNQKKVGRLLRVNKFHTKRGESVGRERVNRLYDRRYFCYEGRIHEQITAINGNKYEMYHIPVTIDHIGYNGSLEDLKKKSERNIKLLNEMVHEDGEDPYLYYQLGKSYYMMEDYAGAVPYFEKATTFDLNPKLEYVSDLIETYGYALLNSGQAAAALQFEGIYKEFARHADFVFLMGNIYMENARFEEAVAEYEKAAGFKDSLIDGVNSYLAYYNCGVIRECQGDLKSAVKYYRKCGEYMPALAGIKRIEDTLK